MITLFEKKEACCGCAACAAICPQKAVTMVTDSEGFRYPRISPDLCVECGACLSVCPARKETQSPHAAVKYYGFQSGDQDILRHSASGGAFSALAALFFQRHSGSSKVLVYGASLLEDGTIAHRCVDRQEDLYRLRDSKYVESAMDGCHSRVLEHLRRGAHVLFSGTPCQIHGLKTVAERALPPEARDRLLLVDIICNGVGSPLAWDRYRSDLERQAGQSLTGYTFRDKRAPRGYAVSWRTADGQETVAPLLQNRYWLMYQRGFISRPACSVCTHATLNRSSDITIGDFHNLLDDEKSFDIGAGVSLIIATTEKGRDLCSCLNTEGTVKEFPPDSVLQPRLETPAPKHPLRTLFLKDMGSLPFDLFLKKYGAIIGEKKQI